MLKTEYICDLCGENLTKFEMKGYRLKFSANGIELKTVHFEEASEKIVCRPCMEALFKAYANEMRIATAVKANR